MECTSLALFAFIYEQYLARYFAELWRVYAEMLEENSMMAVFSEPGGK